MKQTPIVRFFADKTSDYRIGRMLFVRGLGLIYLIAIISWWSQVILLVGENGLVPAESYLERVSEVIGTQGGSPFSRLPGLFWMTGASDVALHGWCLAGVLLALCVVAGFLQGPCLAGLWLIYLSILNTGNVFLSFQWDILLLEAGFLALFLSPWTLRTSWRNPAPLSVVNRISLVVAWGVIAKLMFFSGWVKLAWATKDHPEWWPEHTALTYHYMTQPIPTWTAWWAHQLPEWFQKLSIWPMYAIELVFPFFVLLGRWGRLVAALGFSFLMLLILLTGNYTFFNYLTIVLCIPLVNDRFWPGKFMSRLLRIAPGKPGKKEGSPLWLSITRISVAAPALLLLALLNLQVVLSDLYRAPVPLLKMQLVPEWVSSLAYSVAPFHLVSGYGLFRTMTTDRPEIILEGSRDGISWQEYDFKWKPDRLDERPRFVAPHQPRVAWQLWFAALERQFYPNSRNATWFQSLIVKILNGDEAVQTLFRKNPFPGEPPRFLRARLYLYEFTSPKKRKRTGDWWTRRSAGDYLPIVQKN